MIHKTSNYISAFIIGGIAGGVIALLYAPYSGKKLRERINSDVDNCLRNAKQKEEEIINKAIITAGDLVTKTVPLSALIKKYTGGIHDKYRGKIGSEMTSFKAAIKAAVETYKSESVKSKKIQPTGELAEDFFSDYDNVILPKK